jgi:hypothetical protein
MCLMAVYEYAPGKDLSRHFEEQPLPERHVVRVLMQKLALTLAYVHSRGIIHGGLALTALRCNEWPWLSAKHAIDVRFVNFDRHLLYLTGFSKCDYCTFRSGNSSGKASSDAAAVAGAAAVATTEVGSKIASPTKPVSSEKGNAQEAALNAVSRFANAVVSQEGYSRPVAMHEEGHLFAAPELLVMEQELARVRKEQQEAEATRKALKGNSRDGEQFIAQHEPVAAAAPKAKKFDFSDFPDPVQVQVPHFDGWADKGDDELALADPVDLGSDRTRVSARSFNDSSVGGGDPDAKRLSRPPRGPSGCVKELTLCSSGEADFSSGSSDRIQAAQSSPLNAETISAAKNGGFNTPVVGQCTYYVLG